MNIKVREEGDRWVAYIVEWPLMQTYGDTPAGAIGSLVGFYYKAFGIQSITQE